MCGTEEELVNAVVEGSMLDVCKRCSAFGNVIEVKKPIDVPRVKRKIVIEEPVSFVIESCGKLIKEVREKRGLKQADLGKMVGEKESIVQKIEGGSMKPTLTTAKKFERILDIKIIDEYREPSKANVFDLGEKNLTIGDLIKLKKRS